MPNLTTITLSASGGVTSSGTFSTIDQTFGVAGTANTTVMTIQGISGATAVIATGTLALSGTSNVALTGTGTVLVAGTTNVALTGTGNVTIAGTPTVTVASVTGSVTVAQATASSLQVTINSAQLASSLTAAGAMASGYVLSANPTDQPVPLKVQSITSGMTASRVTATAGTNGTSLKAGAGNVYEIDVYNMSTSPVYLKMYNSVTAPNVGTSTVLWTIPLGATSGYSKEYKYGINFSTGIAYATTGASTDADTSTVPAGCITGIIEWI